MKTRTIESALAALDCEWRLTESAVRFRRRYRPGSFTGEVCGETPAASLMLALATILDEDDRRRSANQARAARWERSPDR